MRIAGIGFRDGARLSSILDALEAAGAAGVRDIALPARKAGHPLAGALRAQGHALTFVPDAALRAVATPTESPAARRAYGTGCVAEAAALAAASSVGGAPARLLHSRAISGDRQATAALAITGGDA